MDLAYCVQCGGSFIRDEATDTICGDCDPGNVFTKPGAVWSGIVNEIEWLQTERGDLSAALAEIENQLGSEYWESEAVLTVTVSEGVAELILEVENTERSEPDSPRRRLGEILEALEEVDRAIDKALRYHVYPSPEQEPLTADKYPELAGGVRQLQTEYGALLSNALGELANLVPERGRS